MTVLVSIIQHAPSNILQFGKHLKRELYVQLCHLFNILHKREKISTITWTEKAAFKQLKKTPTAIDKYQNLCFFIKPRNDFLALWHLLIDRIFCHLIQLILIKTTRIEFLLHLENVTFITIVSQLKVIGLEFQKSVPQKFLVRLLACISTPFGEQIICETK